MSNRVNIPETVTLVLKNSLYYKFPWAYIAIDKSSLESGLRWAESKQFPSESITIKNGSIKAVTIYQASDGSSTGGKLSFWTCILTLPDDRQCFIGINSDNLCDFIKVNNFVNGKCEANIYLGRENSQQAMFTENMDSYQEGLNKRELKSMKQSANYKPGDIVQSMTQNQVYIGKIYRYLDIYQKKIYSYSTHGYIVDYIVVWNRNPEVIHWLPSINIDTMETDIYIYTNQCYSKKPKRIITEGSITQKEMERTFDEAINRYEEFISDPNRFVSDLRAWLYNYTFSQKLLDETAAPFFESAIKGKIIRYEKYMERSGDQKIRDIFFYYSDDKRLAGKIRENFIEIS